MGISGLFQRGKPPAKPIIYAVAAVAAASMVAGWAGDLLLAEIVDRNPLLLIILSPRNRNLVLATNELSATTYYVVGFLRLIASDPANYLLGYWFGERALRWVKRRSKTYGPLMDDGESLFQKIGPLVVFLAPNNIVCALAGATGMKVRTFFTLNVLGTIFRLATIRRLGESLESPIGSVTDWIGEHRVWVLGLSAVALAWTIFGEFRGDDSELQTLRDLANDSDNEYTDREPADSEPGRQRGHRMSRSDQDRLMDGIYWYGIPTLFRAPHDADPANADIGLVGVPHSTGNGTTQRDQHLGPRAVRNVSAIGRRVHNKFELDPWEACRIHDLGDVALSEGNNNERSIEMITDYYSAIDAAGCRPVSIGGDHSITGGILQALGGANSRLTGGEKACLLHFDAHTDAFHNVPHFMGAIKSAAHWASYLVTDGHVDPEHSVQVGIRGNTRSLEWLDPSYDLGYEVIRKTDYDDMGADKVKQIIDDRIGDRPLYITFDLDCLDPTVAPGVANIEAGIEGFGMDQVVDLLQSVRGKNVIGGDVVCLMPTVDSPNQITSYRAMAVMFEIVSLIADRVKDN